ncbi:MAG: tetratricopeptide repeat protein [Roseinatronobacter sp.]
MKLLRKVAVGVVLFAGLLSPAQAQTGADVPPGLASALLAGRVAVTDDNFAQMALNYDRALQVSPDNPGFLDLALQGHLLAGNFERAAELAAQVAADAPGAQVAGVVLQADEFLRGAYGAVIGAAEAGRLTGPLTDAVSVAWAHLGEGRMSDALAAFDAAITERPEIAPFAIYHKALALALVGDLEGAADLLTGEVAGPVSLTRRGVLAHIAILSQLGRFDEAQTLGAEMFGSSPDEDVARLMQAVTDGQAVPFDTVRSAADGMAEAYLLLSSALLNNDGDWLPLIYARLALALRPDHPDAILLAGQLLEQMGQYDLAKQIYSQMPSTSPQYLNAQLATGTVMQRAGDADGAEALLKQLIADRPNSVLALSALGDLMRREERFTDASDAYARAIELLPEVESRHWPLLYTYAISLERQGAFDRAEPVFRQALEFVPDNPQVLNYLGYSLIEAGRNLEEALDMIERAVEGEPDSGYITDSLAWALFRLGRYDEALPVMERAVELMPTDPILNDHLGDVYWAVGRAREARFQWSRALSFAPHPDLSIERVRRKLEVGLDIVQEEEGAPPLASVGQ